MFLSFCGGGWCLDKKSGFGLRGDVGSSGGLVCWLGNLLVLMKNYHADYAAWVSTLRYAAREFHEQHGGKLGVEELFSLKM